MKNFTIDSTPITAIKPPVIRFIEKMYRITSTSTNKLRKELRNWGLSTIMAHGNRF